MKKYAILSLMLFSVAIGFVPSAARAASFDHSHSVYDALLKRHVRAGRVDYRGFLASGDEFAKYLAALGSASEADLKTWSREQKLAFWINSYNAFTLKAILDNYPIKGSSFSIYPKNSIRQISGVWDKLKFQAAGRMITLEGIEHGILRKDFGEPRIHFAIVCASIGCPDLRAEAYRADILDKQLESAGAGFIGSSQKGVKISAADKSVKVSKIFSWFAEDFKASADASELFKNRDTAERGVLNFISKYLRSEGDRAFFDAGDFKLSYLSYDWTLNEQKTK
ncbi:MAG: DUF547 domain-containing protein [Deltaproteobacteria bacterium]